MILVRVRQHQPEQVLPLLLEEGDVGKDQVDARQVLLVAERHAEIDRKPAPLVAIAEAVDRQVHADLADAAERRKCQLIRPRHQAAPAELEAASPKNTSPEAIGTRRPSAVTTIRCPPSSMVSNVPVTVRPPTWIVTGPPTPAA